MSDDIDDDINEETLRSVEAWIERDEVVLDGALSALYGQIPHWVPQPAVDRARRIVRGLINCGFDAANICARVAEAIEGRDVLAPGIVRDAGAYFRDVHELAHLKYAISRGKADGLLIVAGKQAAHGQAFSDGRKRGAGGPIRKAIAALLKRRPTMKNLELWEAIANRPLKGWTAFNNRLGVYLEGPSVAQMRYRRFCNVCGEERRKLR